ncbi:hypothetical protein NQ317_013066 [Molorchus minor]|uniref:Uncharacterized protein n=1 Tax=Molorchus minor TaxID=1323400 RepID=A0ABQ9JSK2_9CUCU|nr:hypothetical protein NQ317_013066 [Molorchus minor]
MSFSLFGKRKIKTATNSNKHSPKTGKCPLTFASQFMSLPLYRFPLLPLNRFLSDQLLQSLLRIEPSQLDSNNSKPPSTKPLKLPIDITIICLPFPKGELNTFSLFNTWETRSNLFVKIPVFLDSNNSKPPSTKPLKLPIDNDFAKPTSNFNELEAFSKRKSKSYKPKKVISIMHKFPLFLLNVLIMGYFGGCLEHE